MGLLIEETPQKMQSDGGIVSKRIPLNAHNDIHTLKTHQVVINLSSSTLNIYFALPKLFHFELERQPNRRNA